MTFDMNPAEDDPHGECRHEIDRLQAENQRLREAMDCLFAIAIQSEGIAGWHMNGEVFQWDDVFASNEPLNAQLDQWAEDAKAAAEAANQAAGQ